MGMQCWPVTPLYCPLILKIYDIWGNGHAMLACNSFILPNYHAPVLAPDTFFFYIGVLHSTGSREEWVGAGSFGQCSILKKRYDGDGGVQPQSAWDAIHFVPQSVECDVVFHILL